MNFSPKNLLLSSLLAVSAFACNKEDSLATSAKDVEQWQREVTNNPDLSEAEQHELSTRLEGADAEVISFGKNAHPIGKDSVRVLFNKDGRSVAYADLSNVYSAKDASINGASQEVEKRVITFIENGKETITSSSTDTIKLQSDGRQHFPEKTYTVERFKP